jgi:hypothetical protein
VTTIAGVALVAPGVAGYSESPSLGIAAETSSAHMAPESVLSDDPYCYQVEREDRSVEDIRGTNRDRFFSVDRTRPDSSHVVPDTNPEANWDSRVAQCDALSNWNDFHDCMWWPWVFGY